MNTTNASHQYPTTDLGSAVEEFLCDCRLRGLSPTTIEWYKYTLGPFVRFAESHGLDDAIEIQEHTVRTFLAARAEEVQPRRVNHYRQAIFRLFEWLRDWGRVNHNPAERIEDIRESKKLIPTFSEEELKALLAQPDTDSFLGLRDYVFMLLLLDTGVRLSEALGLRIEDVDFTSAILKVLGKGRKERLVGFSRSLERNLRRYLPAHQAALGDIDRPDCPWLFPNNVGARAASKGFQTRLKRYGEMAGITRVRVSPHTFRHTFAVWFIRKGGSVFHLQKILGHSSLDMSRRYCELADTDAVERQQELSPLATMDLDLRGRRRLR